MPATTDANAQLHHLYQDHHGWLQGWLRKRLGDREHAADVAQDTFLRLLLSGRFPGHHRLPIERLRLPRHTGG